MGGRWGRGRGQRRGDEEWGYAGDRVDRCVFYERIRDPAERSRLTTARARCRVGRSEGGGGALCRYMLSSKQSWKTLSVASRTGRRACRTRGRVRRTCQDLLTMRLVPAGVQASRQGACWWCLRRWSSLLAWRMASLIDGKPRLPETLLFMVLHLATQIAKGALGLRGEEYTHHHNPSATRYIDLFVPATSSCSLWMMVEGSISGPIR